MLPVKLVRSLFFGDAINNPLLLSQNHHFFHQQQNDTEKTKTNKKKKKKKKTPLMLFIPTKELVLDTFRLASLARDIGLDLYPDPSLSHIIFSWPSSLSSSSSLVSSWSSTSSLLLSLPNDAVPVPFPSFANVSLTLLRLFVSLSKGFFKLVFIDSDHIVGPTSSSTWDCSSLSLISRLTGERIETMDEFSKALLGIGWTLFKTMGKDGSTASNNRQVVFLYRKVELSNSRMKFEHQNDGGAENCYRVRELKLPPLDFRNTPLQILHYILLMTDHVFYLG